MTERWATLALHGTWNAYRTAGIYDLDAETHVQRLYDAMPEPRLQLAGIGKRHGKIGKALGGAFGVGAKNRVNEAVEWLTSRTYDRLLIVAHSRGCGVAGALVRRMETERDKAWRRGRAAPRWASVDALVMLDPVLSFGLDAPAKWVSRVLPRKLRWRLNIDRYRVLPSFVRVLVATYALDERRPAFAQTHFRLTDTSGHEWARWLPGVHSDHGGYGPDEQAGADVGAWVRKALLYRYPELAVIAWPWPEIRIEEWEETDAAPAARRALPGDLATMRRAA